MSAPTDPLPPGQPDGPAQELAFIRTEAGIEIGLLHERVNALLAAEAFLTIAFTAAMSNGTAWGETFARVVGPILAVLGLLLALLAWPGIDGTVRMVLDWTARQQQLLDEHPVLVSSARGLAARGGAAGGPIPTSDAGCCSSARSRSCSHWCGSRSFSSRWSCRTEQQLGGCSDAEKAGPFSGTGLLLCCRRAVPRGGVSCWRRPSGRCRR